MYNVYDYFRSVEEIYLDFQKVFDKVPHMRLLTKLKAHGVFFIFFLFISKDAAQGQKQR